MTDIRIELASRADVPFLAAVEESAATLFADTPYSAEVSAGTLPISVLESCRANDLLWVARVGDTTEPVGFGAVILIDGAAHLHELSVRSDMGRQGIGSALMKTILTALTSRSYNTVTLSTYRDVPWNGPYYARLGFREVGSVDLTPGLLRIRENEAAEGLDVSHRVIMRLELKA